MISVDRPCTREMILPFPGSLISTFLGYCRCFSYQNSCLDVLSGDPRWESGGAILEDLEEVGIQNIARHRAFLREGNILSYISDYGTLVDVGQAYNLWNAHDFFPAQGPSVVIPTSLLEPLPCLVNFWPELPTFPEKF